MSEETIRNGPSDDFDSALLDLPLLSRQVSVGGCRVSRKLRESDEGNVYEAEREEADPRHVALMIAESAMDGRQVVGRFEREAVGSLDHPAIARIHDVGVTTEDRAYFVMERVHGSPITGFCDEKRLGIRERLHLFVRVCDAVQHAHDRGVLHLDIRPANVLVGPEDGEPELKITGFGIARATARRFTERTRSAERGTVFGAPESMSPEQAAERAVDARTDVFSLGLLLYELLVGTLPFNSDEMRRAGLDEMRRRIREEQPIRPSTRLVELGDLSTRHAQSRDTRPAALIRLLRGDLDRIVLRAIERNPSMRHATPGELASEIRGYLSGKSASPARPGVVARLLSFIPSRRVALVAIGVSAVVIVSLLIGKGLVGWPFAGKIGGRSGGAVPESVLAEQESAVADQVSRFLAGVFDVSNREASGLTTSEILDRAAERLDAELLDRPRIRVRLLVTLGESYRRVGNHDRAEVLLGQGLAGTRDLLGGDHPETLRAMEGLAVLYESQGKFDEAEPLFMRIVESRRGNQGDEHPETLTSLAHLAGMYVDAGLPDKAEPLYREVLDTRRSILGDDHGDTLQAMVEFGEFYRAQGQVDRLEGMCLQILETRRRVLGPDHSDTLASLRELTSLYREQGRPNEAASLQREILEALSRGYGDDDAKTLEAIDELARLYVAADRLEEAEPLFREAGETRRRVLGDGHPNTLTSMTELGALYLRQGRHDRAEPLLVRAVRDARRSLPENHLVTGVTLKTYGKCLLGTKGFNEAEEALLDAHEILKSVLGPEHDETVETVETLVELYKGAGAPRMAAAWRARLPE